MIAFFNTTPSSPNSRTKSLGGSKRVGYSSKRIPNPRRDIKSESLEKASSDRSESDSTGSRNSWSHEEKVRLLGLLESIKSELRNMNKLFRKKFGD